MKIKLNRISVKGYNEDIVITPKKKFIDYADLESVRKSYMRDESDVVRFYFEEVEE